MSPDARNDSDSADPTPAPCHLARRWRRVDHRGEGGTPRRHFTPFHPGCLASPAQVPQGERAVVAARRGGRRRLAVLRPAGITGPSWYNRPVPCGAQRFLRRTHGSAKNAGSSAPNTHRLEGSGTGATSW